MARGNYCAGVLAVLALSLFASGCDSSSTGASTATPVAGATPAPTTPTSQAPGPAVTTTFASVPAAVEVMRTSASDGNNDQLRAVGTWLAGQGQSAIAPLVAVMTDTSLTDPVRLAACRILGDMGPVAREALHTAVESDNSYVQRKAIESLGALKPVEESTVVVIVGQLDSQDELVVRQAIGALGRIGEPAASAADQLQKMQNDISLTDSVRDLAHESLRKIQPRRDFTGLDES